MSSRPSRGAARLASILDALPDALLIVNANGTVVNANAIALETFEAPGTALVGRGLLDLLPQFDPKRIPGSMRSPSQDAEESRTKPTRMTARRTDGTAFPVQVTSANLEDGRTPFAHHGDGMPHYTGDELLMLVVRDLSGTVDTEAELARQQRQTEMILRAAAEGVVGVDTAGKVVLVNPSAAQILGYRATDLGGKELHPLVHHSRPDGTPLAYEETPLADTLRSGRKHRVRGQVLWRKDGTSVPVDLTTAPVREGDQLVGAVMTFTDRTQFDALAARARQLRALLDTSLRGPLAELRAELGGLAADPAGHLWPEANRTLHHLSAGYSRITTLIDNVLAFQRLDRGEDTLRRSPVALDDLVGAAVEGAVELIGPGRAQYAVHAPQDEVTVDGERLAQALAHLVADVAGIDSAGNATAHSGDSTIVVAAALRGESVRVDVRGPSAGGDPVHLPLARGIVERHGGVLQTHEVPGQGSAYVLEFPAGPAGPGSGSGSSASTRGAGARAAGHGGTAAGATGSPGASPAAGAVQVQGGGTGSGAHAGAGGTRRAHGRGRPAGQTPGAGPAQAAQAQAQAPVQGGGPGGGTGGGGTGTGAPGRRAGQHAGAGNGNGMSAGDPGSGTDGAPGGRGGSQAAGDGAAVAWALPAAPDQHETPSGRRRALRRPGEDEHAGAQAGVNGAHEVPQIHQGQRTAAEPGPGGPGAADLPRPTGRRARRAARTDEGPAEGDEATARPELPAPPIPNALPPADGDAQGGPSAQAGPPVQGGTGRRARRAIEAPGGSAPPAPVPPHGTAPGPLPGPPGQVPWPGVPGQAGAPGAGPVAVPPQGTAAQQPEPTTWPAAPRPELPAAGTAWPEAPGSTGSGVAPGRDGGPGGMDPAAAARQQQPVQPPHPLPQQPQAHHPQLPQHTQQNQHPQPNQQHHSHGRAISVRTLGQGVPYAADPHAAQGEAQTPSQGTAGGSGRRRKLAAPQQSSGSILPQVPSQVRPPQPPAPGAGPAPVPPQGQPQVQVQPQTRGPGGETQARQHPQADPDSGQLPVRGADPGRAQHVAPAQGQVPGQAPGPAPGQAPVHGQPGHAAQGVQASAPAHAGPDDRDTALLRPVPAARDQGPGRSYAIGAPAAGAAEGPEPLDGPNGAVDVTDEPRTAGDADDRQDMPLDEPRRLLVWPEPDVSTRQALTDRGYRPVIVRSREEVDAQVAEPPAALFVDPLTGPITRTALQSLRQAAAAADVPVLVTAGLGQATREAAYGADPAVLLKALAPRDSEQHPPRVLLVESHEPIAQAFAATLERRGMQVTHAASEAEAMTQAAQVHPNLVVMDLMLVRRRRQGIVDWLRSNTRLNTTPLVVYTAVDIDATELPRLASGETVLFLAERSTSTDVQARIVDLLGKIGA